MTTREQAILYWLLILLVLFIIFRKKNNLLDSIRSVLISTAKFLFNPIATMIILTNFFYLLATYYFSYKVSITVSLWYIKDYLIVLLFSVFPIVAYLKKLNVKKLVYEKKTEVFSLATIPLFLNSSYTLPVTWEMILVFILTILSVFVAFADRKEDTKNVSKFFNFFVVSIGLFMLFTSLYQFLKNINDVFTLDFWLSFGIEPLVWIFNIPVIYLAREMVSIERKIIYSDYTNRIHNYVKYALKIVIEKIKFRKYKKADLDVEEYILESKELSSIGGNRIYIKLNCDTISNSILIAMVNDAILGSNKYTGIINQRERYPNLVEIRNENNELYAFWQDSFVTSAYRDTRIEKMKTVDVMNGIKLVQK
ncbi:hypothetical protein [Enterococcus casseliflavus]|uniref:hypothetical protein n=1 Tax=Enterococcus casseliflavus TaxID=37734 RepID=UPI0018848232|nr:hypothetical protein [Enterococcus casseliflavus]MBE9908984.1 hypothetical protein [Enterococcus casseliflavus]